jgi:hypothetical protein
MELTNKPHRVIKHSANASLFIQFITAIADIYVLTLKIPVKYLILKQLLIIELVVQVVEGSFYIWLTRSFHSIENITPYRYYDWYITTPTMLLTFSIYLLYLKSIEELKNEDETKHEEPIKDEGDIKQDDTLYSVIKKNLSTFSYIIFFNTLMLTFGLLNENHILNKFDAVFLGFISFFIVFYLIYNNYAKYSEKGKTLFTYFSGIWSIYGISALMPYHLKNIFYNILDLFSKNFFGLYLAYILWGVSH